MTPLSSMTHALMKAEMPVAIILANWAKKGLFDVLLCLELNMTN